MSRASMIASLLLFGGCGVSQADLDAAVAGLATTADVQGVSNNIDDAVEDGIEDHLADVDHGPWTDASALTEGTLDVARLPVRPRTIPVNLFGVYRSASATLSTGGLGNTYIGMPDGVSSDVRFSIVVPEDFVGTELTLRVGWRTGATDCQVVLQPNSLDRHREGLPPSSGSASGGFTGPLAPLMAGPTPEMGYVAEYTLGAGGGFPDVQPGDGMAISLFRSGSSASDTCADTLQLVSFAVVYDAQ